MTSLFDAALAGTTRTAFHLEQRDVYGVPDSQRASYDAFLTESRVDTAFMDSWAVTIREAVGRGIEFRRLRLVSEPLSDYVRWEHALTAFNVAAGEQVRWLPRLSCPDLLVVPVDFWVFDSDTMLMGRFSGDGVSAGQVLHDDPAVIKAAVECFETAWVRAVPHDSFTPA